MAGKRDMLVERIALMKNFEDAMLNYTRIFFNNRFIDSNGEQYVNWFDAQHRRAQGPEVVVSYFSSISLYRDYCRSIFSNSDVSFIENCALVIFNEMPKGPN